MITVNASKCPQDHPCPMVPRCPKGAISQTEFSAPHVDTNKCIECMFCVNHCPYHVFQKA